MKNLLLFLLPLVIMACKTSSTGTSSSNEKRDSKKTVVATVVKETFENKAGRVINGVEDYYLEYGGERWFVKFSCSLITPQMLVELENKTASFKVEEKEGLWDTDDPNVQSRVGKYVCIHEILPTTP